MRTAGAGRASRPAGEATLGRLMRPASVAVVGATARPGSYAHQTLSNLRRLGYDGPVVAVNPRRAAPDGVACVPSLADLDGPVDAVVVAVPAAAASDVVEAAGAIGCGGAVVYAAGFAETPDGVSRQEGLRAAALAHGLPVCGPNGNGIVSLHRRVALWGDPVEPQPAGPVAIVTQSGNVGVNALASRRGLGLHTVVSCGNQAVLDAADYLRFLADEDGVRAVAMYLESDGDGARLCEALARCARRDVRVVVLKAGASRVSASAAQAHTGAIAGDQRVFRALVAEAGAVAVEDPHELLEVAKALAVRRRAPRPGLAMLTCSGGDSAIVADAAERQGVPIPPLADVTVARLREVLPEAATAANPLDYTSLLWGDGEALRAMIAALAADPGIGCVVAAYDQVPERDEAARAAGEAIRAAVAAGAAESTVPVLLAATLPELLDEQTAEMLAAAGVPAVAGLSMAVRCAAALGVPAGQADRLRTIGAACASKSPGTWLAEHATKERLRAAGLAVAAGEVARDAEAAVAIARRLGFPVALKLSHPELRHKSEIGALRLGLAGEAAVREAFSAVAAAGAGLGATAEDAVVLVERMAAPGAELIVAARRDAVVPALVVGLGGVWTEALDDVAVLVLPTDADRVERALRGLRAASLLTGGRGGRRLDLAAAARTAAAAGDVLLDGDLDLLELNPVIVHERGTTIVDALARARSTPQESPA